MKTELQGMCPTPSPGGNHTGQSGGADINQGAAGMVSSPYSDGICPTPGGKETAGELGTTPYLTDVKDGQSGGSASAIGLLNSHQSDQTFNK